MTINSGEATLAWRPIDPVCEQEAVTLSWRPIDPVCEDDGT